MVVLICGPAGSGKSTLLERLSEDGRFGVITVMVTRRQPRRIPEAGRIELNSESFQLRRLSFQFHYHYDDSEYGFSIPAKPISSFDYDFLDYPGEYPACEELQSIPWRGLLVLPPSLDVLIQRLLKQGKENRVTSAIEEYSICLRELSERVYREPQWRLYISRDNNALDEVLHDAAAFQLFASRDERP
jgi:hypothetical protein